MLISGYVGGYDLEDEVAGARDVMALDDLVDLAYSGDEFFDVVFVVAFEGNHHERADADADASRVDDGVVATNDAGGFEFVYAFEGRCRGQSDFLGQLGVGDVGVGLEDFEDLAIGTVYFDGFHAFEFKHLVADDAILQARIGGWRCVGERVKFQIKFGENR